MPFAWIEKLENERVKKWAYDQLVKGEVLWAGDRRDYGCVVAEIPLTDEDIERFDISKGVTILLCPADRSRAIDDPLAQFSIDDIEFDLECVD
jgi:hypothetical protein